MPSEPYTIRTTPVAHSSRRRGWHDGSIGLLDQTGRLVVRLTVTGLSLVEVDRVARHVAAALEQMPAEPPARPPPLHRT